MSACYVVYDKLLTSKALNGLTVTCKVRFPNHFDAVRWIADTRRYIQNKNLSNFKIEGCND